MNWEIEVFNRTRDYINEDQVRIDKDKSNEVILAFNDAYQKKDDAKMAELLDGEVLTFFERLEAAAKELA